MHFKLIPISKCFFKYLAKPESEYVNFAGKNSHQKKEEENVYSNQTGAKTGQSGDQKAGESEYANHTGTKPGTQVDTPGQKPFKVPVDIE